MGKEKLTKCLLFCAALAALMLVAWAVMAPSADAAIYVGNTELQGYRPNDIVHTDMNVSLDPNSSNNVALLGEHYLLAIVAAIMPILALAAVAKIIWTAISNIWKKPEDQVKVTGVVKSAAEMFFWVLFSWIIVELIIYGVTGGWAIAYQITNGG